MQIISYILLNGGKKLFKINELKEIINLIDESNIKEFELEYEGTKIKLKKQVESVVESNSIAVQNNTPIVENTVTVENKPQNIDSNNFTQIKSPMVGTFYKSASPDSEAYVNVGDKINENTVICIVEAMKLFNEIKAEISGEIVEILAQEGQLVEYGQPLFLVK